LSFLKEVEEYGQPIEVMDNNNPMKTIVELLQKYRSYGLGNSLDYERFNN
jgi:hypothetical protein